MEIRDTFLRKNSSIKNNNNCFLKSLISIIRRVLPETYVEESKDIVIS